MIRKKIILSVIIICFLLLSGCFYSKDYPRYEIEELGKRQYILTTPEGNPYVMLENEIWFPEILYAEDVSDAIGICDLGYIYETTSEICLFTSSGDARNQHFFFPEDTILPELKIENINNTSLKETYDRDSQIMVDKESAEKLIELYHNTEMHETKKIHSTLRTWELVMESEQYRGLYFSRPIYKYNDYYYLYIKYEYDKKEDTTTYILCECTSVINNILENN